MTDTPSLAEARTWLRAQPRRISDPGSEAEDIAVALLVEFATAARTAATAEAAGLREALEKVRAAEERDFAGIVDRALATPGPGAGHLEAVRAKDEKLDRLRREREELADLLGDMAHADCNCGDCYMCKARRYVVHECHDGDCTDDRVHDCHSSTCREQQPFVLPTSRAKDEKARGLVEAVKELKAAHLRMLAALLHASADPDGFDDASHAQRVALLRLFALAEAYPVDRAAADLAAIVGDGG